MTITERTTVSARKPVFTEEDLAAIVEWAENMPSSTFDTIRFLAKSHLNLLRQIEAGNVHALVSRYRFRKHDFDPALCPVCGEHLERVGITELVYSMDVCTCRNDIDYDHLVEQLWHRKHFVEAGGKRP